MTDAPGGRAPHKSKYSAHAMRAPDKSKDSAPGGRAPHLN